MFYRYSVPYMFLALGIISIYLPCTEACTCAPETRRQQCQRAEFSFIGRPFFAGTIGTGLSASNRYCFVIERVIKGSIFVLPNPCVVTPTQSSLCGIGFQNFRQYVVNGFRRDGLNQVNLCGWNELWTDVPNNIKFRYLTRRRFCRRAMD